MSEKPLIKAVIFDADGVVVTPREIFGVELARRFGVSRERQRLFFTGPFLDCLVGKADLKAAIGPYLDKWGWDQGVEAMLEAWFSWEDCIDQRLVDYVQNLREHGLKCYIATNQERYRLAYMAERMGFSLAFDGIFGSADIGYRKPDSNFFAAVVESLGMARDEVLFWDDTSANVVAAGAFGLHAEEYKSFVAFEARMGGLYFPMSDAIPLPSAASGEQRAGRVFSARLETFLDNLDEGETPNSGTFCSFCYTPVPAGLERCDHCGQSQSERPPVQSVPDAVVDMYRRKQRRESLIVNSFAYLGLALGMALFLGLVAINVLYLDKALWFFLLATVIFLVGSRLLAAIVGGVIGDEIGFRYGQRKLAEDWAAHISRRETER